MSEKIAKKWHSKFEFKAGKWIFIPTGDGLSLGRRIHKKIKSSWTPPEYYYHLQRGGHIAASKVHTGNSYFVRLDICNFFGSISRGRVTRTLKPLVGYKTAREYAHASTVKKITELGTMIPYGFPQSQILASVCLYNSALGVLLNKIFNARDVVVSVYVDDIIISSDTIEKLKAAEELVKVSAIKAGFELNSLKQQGPSQEINSFNIDISKQGLKISESRMNLFQSRIWNASPEEMAGIHSYVNSVNPMQLNLL